MLPFHYFLISFVTAHKPRLWIEEDRANGAYAAMMVLYPDFKVGKQKNTEFIIAVDRYCSISLYLSFCLLLLCPRTYINHRSASMEPSITAASRCLSVVIDQFLKHQIKHTKAKLRFNVVSFGSHFETLFPVSVPVSDDAVRQARGYASRLRADYGGNYHLSFPYLVSSYPLFILFI